MKKKYIYGAAYYEEYLPYDRLREDFEIMKKAGFSTIRIAESTWSTEEPKEGEYDFSHVERVLDMAEKYNIDVIIGTPTYAVPYWLAQKDSDVLATTRWGKNIYGTRQNMDITNKTFLSAAEGIIRELVSRTANRKCVIGFQIDNETKHYDTSSDLVQQGFKQYLKNKFKTIEKLNDEFGFAYWSNSVTSFEDLPNVAGTINASYGCAFEEYQRSLASDYLVWQSNIVKEYKRDDQFITQNFDFDWQSFGPSGAQDGFSHGLQNGICHFDAASALTIAGVDVYHNTQDLLSGMEIAFAGDEMRNLLPDKNNYIVLETQAQAFKEWTPYPGQLRLCALSHMASGATGVMYWNYHSIHNSKETYWKGLLSHDFEENPAYNEACKVSRELQNIYDIIGDIKHNNKVAIMMSNNSMTALKWFPTDKNYSYNDILISYYKALYECNIECDLIYPQSSEWEHKYDVIITPALYCVSDNNISRFKSFVQNGGTLISSFRSFVSNENVKVAHTKLPNQLTDVFGMTYNQYTNPVNVTVDGSNVSYWMEFLNPIGANAVYNYNHKYWGEYAAVTKNKYQKGTAWYIGCVLDDKKLKDILCQAIGEATDNEYKDSFPIIEKTAIAENGDTVHFVFNYSSDENQYEMMTSGKIIYGTDKKFISKGEKITLSDWGAVVFWEEKNA